MSSNSRRAGAGVEGAGVDGDSCHGRATRGDEKLLQELGRSSSPGGKEGDHCRRVQQTESREGKSEVGFKLNRAVGGVS